MTIATPSALGLPSARTLEWLAGSDLLAFSPGTSTDQLASLGPVASLVETSIGGDDPAAEGTALPAALTAPANQAVLETHAQLEDTGHQVTVLNGPLHGLTNLGETIGLGHLGTSGNLVTDIASATQGSQTQGIPGDAANVVTAAANLAETIPAAANSGGGLVGDAGALAPLTETLNQGVLSLHASLEEVGHQNPALNGPIHGLTGLGETIGLGHVGAPGNVVTDVAGLPGSILAGGGVASLAPVLGDLGNVTTALGSLANQLASAPSTAGGLLSTTGPLAPVAGIANEAVLDLHAGIEGVGHDVPALNGTLHAVTNLGETVGLGHLGETSNLVTDIANLPGAVLSGGGVAALAPVLQDLGHVTAALDTLVDQVAAAPGTGGGLLSPAGALAPVSTVANTAVLDLHAGIEGVGHDVPALNDAVHAVTGLGETVGLGHLGEPGSLVTDAVNLPGTVLAGGGAGAVAPVLADAGVVLGSTGTLAGAVTGVAGSGDAAGAPLQAVTEALGPVGHAADLPTQVVGGATGLLGGGPIESVPLAGGLVDALASSGGEGSHPLVDVGAGPATPTPVVDANVLSAPAEAGHAVQVSAVGVGSAVPTLASVSLLSGDGIAFPASGGGADALVGHAIALAPTSTPAHADAAPAIHLDLGAAALDLGGHVDGHAADAQPHASASGLHLLGL
ncbi:hypothetical protein ACLBWX_21735 [Methylobacterium sp. M6A4_1b]